MTLGWPASLAPTRLGASQQQLWQTDRAGQSTMDIIMIRSRAVLPPPSWHGFLLSCKPRAWQQAEGTQTGCRDQQWPPGQCSADNFRAAGHCTFNADPGLPSLPPEWQGSARLTREHGLPAGAACPVEEAILLLEDRGQQSGWLCVASRSAIISA